MTAPVAPSVTVYWRPGCGFCHVLRRELDRAGVDRSEVNIWEDPEAAAVVRSIAWGNETVPTVVVGDKAMVNPSAREVLALLGNRGDTTSPSTPTAGRLERVAGAGWSIGAGMGWLILALTHPTTTYHFAPLLTAVAWPIAFGRRTESLRRSRDGLLAVIASALVAGAILAGLGLSGALAGPALIGSSATEESVIMIAAGTLIGVGFLRPRGGRTRAPEPASSVVETVRGTGGGCTDDVCELTPTDGAP